MSARATWTADCEALVGGSAEGVALVLDEPLSFWGGVDQRTGLIVDERHPQRGRDVSGRVLVMPAGRGSSSSSSVLAEAIRSGHGPTSIVLAETDGMVVLGALVAELLYGITCPVVRVAPASHGRLRSGDRLAIADGRVSVRRGREAGAIG